MFKDEQMTRSTIVSVVLFLILAHTSTAVTTIHVAPSGNDTNPGTAVLPLKTVSECSMRAHESHDLDVTCLIQPGIYREGVVVNVDPVHPKKIRRFQGTQGTQGTHPSATTLSGLDTLPDLVWTRTPYQQQKCMWSAPVSATLPYIQQLFYKGVMQVEARWPNIDVMDSSNAVQPFAADVLHRSTWQTVGKNSTYGSITNKELSAFNFSWKGALATLNVAHQWNTWTRNVTSHTIGASSLTYPKNLPGLANTDNKTSYWDGSCREKCNQYYLSGVLGALDVPGEYYHDLEHSRLHFYPVGTTRQCLPPSINSVEIKSRDYVMQVFAKVHNVVFENFSTIGGTIRMDDCRGLCRVQNVQLMYPTYNRRSTELDVPATKVAASFINGSNIVLQNVTLQYSNNNGLRISGEHIQVDNILIDRTDWLGSLTYAPLHVSGNNITIHRATVQYFGNAGVVTAIPNTRPHATINATQAPPQPMSQRFLEVAHSHIHHGGMVGRDTAALYTGGWNAAGIEWHHNWIHDATEKCLRADDQSQNMSVHHNVVYNCGTGGGAGGTDNVIQSSGTSGLGIILKGGGHVIYANTVFATNYTEMCMPGCVEPLKAFRRQFPLVEQNLKTQIFNTVARRDIGWPCSCKNQTKYQHHPGGNVTSMYQGARLDLENVTNFDFRPKSTSSLVDAGSVVPPYTDGFVGVSPDIGAYEYAGVWWKAGCAGLKGCGGDTMNATNAMNAMAQTHPKSKKEKTFFFPLYWNVDQSAAPLLDVATYDFTPRNFTQVGNGCSNPGCRPWTQGNFPTILDNGTKINGGVPQAGNLTQHLIAFQNGVLKWIPEPLYSGNAVLDFEDWTTVWEENDNTRDQWHGKRYQTESIRLVRQAHPHYNATQVLAAAKQAFELAAEKFFVQSLQLGRKLRPHAVWGFYGRPANPLQPCSGTGSATRCGYDGPHGALYKEYANRQAAVIAASDALFPSIYLSDALIGLPDNASSYVRSVVSEMVRLGGGLPVYAYAWHYYHAGKVIVPVEQTVAVMQNVYESGGSGMVYWGMKVNVSYWDWLRDEGGPATKKWCEAKAGGCIHPTQ